MTYDQLQQYLADIMEADKLDKATDVDFIKRAISLGMKTFWGRTNWYFKNVEYTLTIPADNDAETFDLPDIFESLRVMKEETSTAGGKVIFRTKEQFEREMPKLSNHSQGTPRIGTIYKEYNNDKWKIKFWPQPSGGEEIKISMYITTPTNLAQIPDRFWDILVADCVKHCYPYAHTGRSQAEQIAEYHYRRLLSANKVSMGDQPKIYDETDLQVTMDRAYGDIG